MARIGRPHEKTIEVEPLSVPEQVPIEAPAPAVPVHVPA